MAILYLRYCRTGVLFQITVHVKNQYVTTYDDVILVKPIGSDQQD